VGEAGLRRAWGAPTCCLAAWPPKTCILASCEVDPGEGGLFPAQQSQGPLAASRVGTGMGKDGQKHHGDTVVEETHSNQTPCCSQVPIGLRPLGVSHRTPGREQGLMRGTHRALCDT
jgi:hypothetical protein